HITFARYTSLTPTSGDRSKPGVKNRNKEALKNLNKDWESIKSFAKKGTSTDDDYLYDIPNRDVNIELCDRWTIQDSPPDLLITNYSMLNVMLMRDDENNIFDATKNWLQESEENVFHLVIDELHSYRGTSGTEVAYLLRLLINRLGLKPNSNKLQFLCSSASMQESVRVKKFIAGFFGLNEKEIENRFSIINDEPTIEKNKNITLLDANDFTKIDNLSIDEIQEKFNKYKLLETLEYFLQKPKEVDEVAKLMFPKNTFENAILSLEKILKTLTVLKDAKGNALRPMRAHLFFRNID